MAHLVAIHNLSGLLTAEITPNPRLQLYFYYGGDYAGREDEANPAPAPSARPSRRAEYDHRRMGRHVEGSFAAAAVGYGSRLLSNSACNTNTAPGYNGSSTGYYPGGSCGAQTRDVQEVTGGYWYDIYKGDPAACVRASSTAMRCARDGRARTVSAPRASRT